VPIEVEFSPHGAENVLGDAERTLQMRTLQDHRELIAAEPCHQVGSRIPGGVTVRVTPRSAGSPRVTQRVAGRMSERVIDLLETIKIEHSTARARS